MKFLFFLSQKYSFPIISPIIDYLEKSRLEFMIQITPGIELNLDKMNESVLKYNITTSQKKALEFKPDFVIIPGNFVDYRLPGIKVQIFHGIGIEKSSHYKIRPFFDIYCTSGPCVTRKFKKPGMKLSNIEIIETGWPKVDYIINYPKTGLHDKFAIPRNKRIILYAPTFSKKLTSIPHILSEIPGIISSDEFWLIKLHDLSGKKIFQQIRSRKNENIKIISDPDITPYLHLSDLMISDTSSVIYEFMLLDKPVITYRASDRLDKGINIRQVSELRSAIDRSFSNPDEFRNSRVEHLKEINPYLDGKISMNLISKLIRMKESGFRPQTRKIGPWRKFQVKRWLTK